MYFRKKTSGGRVYLQIAESRRVGGGVRQRVIATLGRLDSLPADVLFLGHGHPQRNREYLHRMQDLLTALVQRVDSAVGAGATKEETEKAVTLADWKQTLAGDDRALQGGFDAVFVQPAVGRAWQQAKGEPDDTQPSP